MWSSWNRTISRHLILLPGKLWSQSLPICSSRLPTIPLRHRGFVGHPVSKSSPATTVCCWFRWQAIPQKLLYCKRASSWSTTHEQFGSGLTFQRLKSVRGLDTSLFFSGFGWEGSGPTLGQLVALKERARRCLSQGWPLFLGDQGSHLALATISSCPALGGLGGLGALGGREDTQCHHSAAGRSPLTFPEGPLPLPLPDSETVFVFLGSKYTLFFILYPNLSLPLDLGMWLYLAGCALPTAFLPVTPLYSAASFSFSSFLYPSSSLLYNHQLLSVSSCNQWSFTWLPSPDNI